MFTWLTNQPTCHRSLLQRSIKVKVTSVSLSLFPASKMSGSCFTTRSESLVRIYANPDKLIQFHLCANLFIRWVLMLMVVDCLLCEWLLPVPRICHLRKDRIMNDGKGREGERRTATIKFHMKIVTFPSSSSSSFKVRVRASQVYIEGMSCYVPRPPKMCLTNSFRTARSSCRKCQVIYESNVSQSECRRFFFILCWLCERNKFQFNQRGSF